MRKLIVGSLFAGLVGIFGCAEESESTPDADESEEVGEVEQEAKQKPICALKCAAPPEGCHYENAVLTGPCHKLTCGDLVCDGSPS